MEGFLLVLQALLTVVTVVLASWPAAVLLRLGKTFRWLEREIAAGPQYRLSVWLQQWRNRKLRPDPHRLDRFIPFQLHDIFESEDEDTHG